MGACQGYRQTSDDAPLLWFRARIPPFLPNVPSIFCLPVSLWPSYPLESSTKLFSFLTCGSQKCTERNYVVDCCLRWSTALLQLVNMFDLCICLFVFCLITMLGISYVQVGNFPCVSPIYAISHFLLTRWFAGCLVLGTYGTRQSPYHWLSAEDGFESQVEGKKYYL